MSMKTTEIIYDYSFLNNVFIFAVIILSDHTKMSNMCQYSLLLHFTLKNILMFLTLGGDLNIILCVMIL